MLTSLFYPTVWTLFNHTIGTPSLVDYRIFPQSFENPTLVDLKPYKTPPKHTWVCSYLTVWDTFKTYMGIFLPACIGDLWSIYKYVLARLYKIFLKYIWVCSCPTIRDTYFCPTVQNTFETYMSMILPNCMGHLWSIHKYVLVQLYKTFSKHIWVCSCLAVWDTYFCPTL